MSHNSLFLHQKGTNAVSIEGYLIHSSYQDMLHSNIFHKPNKWSNQLDSNVIKLNQPLTFGARKQEYIEFIDVALFGYPVPIAYISPVIADTLTSNTINSNSNGMQFYNMSNIFPPICDIMDNLNNDVYITKVNKYIKNILKYYSNSAKSYYKMPSSYIQNIQYNICDINLLYYLLYIFKSNSNTYISDKVVLFNELCDYYSYRDNMSVVDSKKASLSHLHTIFQMLYYYINGNNSEDIDE
jgi:hypothetical protein